MFFVELYFNFDWTKKAEKLLFSENKQNIFEMLEIIVF